MELQSVRASIVVEKIYLVQFLEPVTLPYEVLARGPSSVAAFNNALKHGKAPVCYTQLAIIGDVGAGKTSLVRTLSGEEFREERVETHGIVTSMVEKTDLDSSWKAVDLNSSHVDEILAEKVAEDLRGCEFEAVTYSEEVVAAPQEEVSHPNSLGIDSFNFCSNFNKYL